MLRNVIERRPAPVSNVDYFDTEKFIDAIFARPSIYAKFGDEHYDQDLKVQAWKEICEIMIPKWHTFNLDEQDEREKLLKSKWRNIRDYFMKEHRALTSEYGNSNGPKRKKYVYYDKLQFLVQLEDKKSLLPPRRRVKIPRTVITASDSMFDEVPISPMDNSRIQTNESKGYVVVEGYPKDNNENKSIEDIYDIAETYDSQQADEDYDKMFLHSLLPVLRRVPEEKKLNVRIDILQVLASASCN